MPANNRFVIGDEVEWVVHSKSNLYAKRGVVTVVVPAGRNVHCYGIRNPGLPRSDESYIVSVDGKPFWPVTKLLRKVQRG